MVEILKIGQLGLFYWQHGRGAIRRSTLGREPRSSKWFDRQPRMVSIRKASFFISILFLVLAPTIQQCYNRSHKSTYDEQCIYTSFSSMVAVLMLLLALAPRRELLSHTISCALVTALPSFDGPVWLSDSAKEVDGSTASHAGSSSPPTRLYSITETVTAQPYDNSAISTLHLVLYPDPILRRSASPVTEFGPALEHVVQAFITTMTTNSTTALHYGIDARIVVLKGPASPLPSGASPLVLVNPNVLARSSEDKMVVWREYCGTLPFLGKTGDDNGKKEDSTIMVDLFRDEVVDIAAQDIRGIPIRKTLRGETARAFQHELDHLNGILIIDHANLKELPSDIAKLEAPFHQTRQRRAFERQTYAGNGPLYW